MKFYHATAKDNLASIQQRGLLISERQRNRYGLDYDLNYVDAYDGDARGITLSKPLSIHLTSSIEKAKFYQQLIQESYSVETVILAVEFDESQLTVDPEDESDCYYYQNDISPSVISVHEMELVESMDAADENLYLIDSESSESESSESESESESENLEEFDESDEESEQLGNSSETFFNPPSLLLSNSFYSTANPHKRSSKVANDSIFVNELENDRRKFIRT